MSLTGQRDKLRVALAWRMRLITGVSAASPPGYYFQLAPVRKLKSGSESAAGCEQAGQRDKDK